MIIGISEGKDPSAMHFRTSQLSKEGMIYLYLLPWHKTGLEKLVYRLIVMFLSTEIFSKRRKIYTWAEEKPE